MKKTDADVIELMLRHSSDIQEAIKIFGDDIETFVNKEFISTLLSTVFCKLVN